MRDFVITYFNKKYSIWYGMQSFPLSDEQDGIIIKGRELYIFIGEEEKKFFEYNHQYMNLDNIIVSDQKLDLTSIGDKLFNFCRCIFTENEKVFIEKVKFLHLVLRRIYTENITQEELDSIRFTNTKSANCIHGQTDHRNAISAQRCSGQSDN